MLEDLSAMVGWFQATMGWRDSAVRASHTTCSRDCVALNWGVRSAAGAKSAPAGSASSPSGYALFEPLVSGPGGIAEWEVASGVTPLGSLNEERRYLAGIASVSFDHRKPVASCAR